jgi:hypothetical protein
MGRKKPVGAVSGDIAGDTDKMALTEDFICKYRKGAFSDDEVKKFLKRQNPFSDKPFRIIPPMASFFLGATDGKEVLVDANDLNDLFENIDPDFKNLRADEPGQPKGETTVAVYEIAHGVAVEEIFRLLSSHNFHRVSLTQSQIKAFCKKHYDWLRAVGRRTYFLFESYGRLFIPVVGFFFSRERGLPFCARVESFDYSFVQDVD